MSDESARSDVFPMDQRIAEAVSMGVPLEAIAQHLADSKDESHKLWVQQFKASQTAKRAAERMGEPSEASMTPEQTILAKSQKWVAENPITAAGIATVGTAAAGLGGYALKERIKTNAEIRKEKELAKLEPSEAVKIQREQLELSKQKFAAEQQALIDQETKNVMQQARVKAQTAAPTLSDLQQRAAGLTASVQGKTVPANAIPPQFGPANAPVGNIPPAPPFQPSVETAVATGGNVDQAIKQTVAKELDQAVGVSPEILKTGTGREVVAGQGSVPQRFAKEYKSPTDVPKGYAFVPGAQYIDVLRNDLGQGTYTQQYTGREFPQTYPGAVEEAKNINRELNRPTREQLKAQGAALPETTEGIVRKVGPNKMVKVGGVAGALISLADIAKAENTQQRREAAGNALLGFLPPGMDVNSLNANEAAQLQQLFAQQAYAQQVGGGRGVAPPSAYPQGGLNYNSPRIR